MRARHVYAFEFLCAGDETTAQHNQFDLTLHDSWSKEENAVLRHQLERLTGLRKQEKSRKCRKEGVSEERGTALLFLVFVFLQRLREGECLHGCLLPVEGVHLLLQISALLLYLPLLLLMHALQLLKLFVQLRQWRTETVARVKRNIDCACGHPLKHRCRTPD